MSWNHSIKNHPQVQTGSLDSHVSLHVIIQGLDDTLWIGNTFPPVY